MKKTIKSIPVLIFLIFLGIITIFYNSSSKTEGMELGIEFLKHEQLDTLPIEKTYDYEEILNDMEINGLVTNERIASFKAQHETNTKLISPASTGTVRYAKSAMDSYKFTHTLKKYELTPIFYIGLYYTSDLEPDKIISISEPYIRTSGEAECVFNGNVFYRLERGNSFYYGVNGDVYKATNRFIKNIDFDGRYYSDSLNAN